MLRNVLFSFLLLFIPTIAQADVYYFLLKTKSIYVVNPWVVKKMELKHLKEQPNFTFKIKVESDKGMAEIADAIQAANEKSNIFPISEKEW